MKLELNEQTLNAYINEAIRLELQEMLEEDKWWNPATWGRDRKNARWGYTWDDSLSAKQNRRNRDVNKAQIKAKGYKNYDDMMTGEGPEETEPTSQVPQNQEQGNMSFTPGQPSPFANDRTRVGQFQTWFNDNMGGKLVVDGIWGKYTQAAWDQWVNQNFGGAQ